MMLEVRNLKRVYKVKNNNPVYALNDVSIKFPEKGLVFILGKSGSGKSTLLNVMGGLDKADDGEIIINGKSSKEFTGSEMDSYRNTYLGFIFQEYNILSDFTIKENIALALQLQHKPATDKAINDILAQVDLANMGKRKPNELSGGQKQRVAIARALVKEPKIIFGDEPTGALDSNTGRQVFETLKKLSQDKLVVIVSHDRDFAEHFGDRVIELKDGKVISDVTKSIVDVESPANGISLLGDNIIRIEKNHKLTALDMKIINEKLANSSNDIFISSDSHVNDKICEAGRIDKNGKRQEFKDTNDEDIKVNKDEKFKLIKSHFSFGKAFKMGSKSLRVKPFRLVMTILLSTVAFTLFGISSTLSMFNTKSAIMSTINKNNISSFGIKLNEKYTDSNGEVNYKNGITDSRISEIENNTGTKLYKLRSEASTSLYTNSNTRDGFHLSSYLGTMGIDQSIFDSLGLKLSSGRLPTDDSEVCITKYAYYTYKDYGFGDSTYFDSVLTPSEVSEDKIIGQTLYVNDKNEVGGSSSEELKIVGIIDSNFPSNYEKYRTNLSLLKTNNNSDASSLYSIQTSPNLHSILYRYYSTSSSSISISDAFVDSNGRSYTLGYYTSNKDSIYFDKNKSSISDNEVMLSFYALSTYTNYIESSTPSTSSPTTIEELGSTVSSIYNNEYNNYFSSNLDSLYKKYKSDAKLSNLITQYFSKDYGDDVSYDKLSDADKVEAIKDYVQSYKIFSTDYKSIVANVITTTKNEFSKIDCSKVDASVSGKIYYGYDENSNEVKDDKSYKLVGIDFSYQATYLCVSQNEANAIKNKCETYGKLLSSDATVLFVTYPNKSSLNKFLDYYVSLDNNYKNGKLNIGDYRISLNDTFLSIVETTSTIVMVLTHVFIWIGVAFAIFAALLFYNFISISINNKKREIGILRAVGAKKIDVFKIFFSEAFIIGMINFLISSFLTFVLSFIFNSDIGRQLNLAFDILSPNIWVFLMLFGIAIGVSFISSLLPVSIIANKKPIDAIHNK